MPTSLLAIFLILFTGTFVSFLLLAAKLFRFLVFTILRFWWFIIAFATGLFTLFGNG